MCCHAQYNIWPVSAVPQPAEKYSSNKLALCTCRDTHCLLALQACVDTSMLPVRCCQQDIDQDVAGLVMTAPHKYM